MSERPDPFAPGAIAPSEPVRASRRDRTPVLVSALLLLVVVTLLGGLVGLVALGRPSPGAAQGPAGTPTPAPASFLIADPIPAPPIELTDATGARRALASFGGGPVLVFFGYTHCPDVCPVTIGTVGTVIAGVGGGLHALFVSVDPERDTVAWLAEFTRFMPAGFAALTGTPTEIRATADAWGVRYARVETDSKDGYSMSHTADVFLVDAAGLLRARFPFGTEPESMAAVVRSVVATTPPIADGSSTVAPASPTAAGSSGAPGTSDLRPEIVSTSVWSGAAGPVIVHLADASGPLDDPGIRATLQLLDANGSPAGPVVNATAVQPPGIRRVSHVATLAVPTPGPWRVRVTAFRDGRTTTGEARLVALDPGATIPLGAPAPAVPTPTIASAGSLLAVTTDPNPDPRLSTRSTVDLLAEHRAFVLVIDSVRFRVTPACGKAVSLARYLADRWTGIGFVHLEPYRYSIVTDSAVLDGGINDPPLNEVAGAWGVGPAPWGAMTVPWLYVVDAAGIVRAKYQGLIGSDDVDVILALLTERTGG